MYVFSTLFDDVVRFGRVYGLFVYLFMCLMWLISLPRYIQDDVPCSNIPLFTCFHPLSQRFHAYWGGAYGCGWMPSAWVRCAVAYVLTGDRWGCVGRVGGGTMVIVGCAKPFRIVRS